MRVHAIQHVDFEGPGLIAEWAEGRGHELTTTLALAEEFPDLAEVDLLIVLGGPMGAGEVDRYPWLVAEKRYLQEAIAVTRVLGICLGAQLIVEVAGGSVYRGDRPEIGWYPVRLTDSAWEDPVFARFPDRLTVGHWHNDTFSLPGLTLPTLSSDATLNQAFSLLDGRVVGLQFHLEWTGEVLAALVERCAPDIEEAGAYVMDAEELISRVPAWQPSCRKALFGLLDRMLAIQSKGDTA